jgi:hypothetical protein
MSAKDELDRLEKWGAMVPASSVRKIVEELMAERGPEFMTTVDAARVLGYSPKRWRVWCEGGLVEGAWQDSDNGRWRLPLASARAHLLRLQQSKRAPRKSGRRGPNRQKASPAYPALVRAEGLSAG